MRTHTTAPQVAPAPSRSQPICHPRDPPAVVGSCARGCPPNRVGIHRRLWRICPPNRVGIHRRLWRGSSRIPCPSACPTRARVRSGIQTCTVRSQMSESDVHVPIQNSQYVALFDDFCILVAPERDFPESPPAVWRWRPRVRRHPRYAGSSTRRSLRRVGHTDVVPLAIRVAPYCTWRTHSTQTCR